MLKATPQCQEHLKIEVPHEQGNMTFATMASYGHSGATEIVIYSPTLEDIDRMIAALCQLRIEITNR